VLLGSERVKTAHKHIDEIDPWRDEKLWSIDFWKCQGSRNFITIDIKTYQVHEEVQVDGQVRDEEGSRPSTRVVALHHHIRVAENITSDKRNCFSS